MNNFLKAKAEAEKKKKVGVVYKTTKWFNDTNRKVTFVLNTDQHIVNKNGTQGAVKQVFVEVAPGETVEVSSQYDESIKKVRFGTVVGGKAPQLTKVDDVNDVEADEKILSIPADVLKEEKELQKIADTLKKNAELEDARKVREEIKNNRKPGRPKKDK